MKYIYFQRIRLLKNKIAAELRSIEKIADITGYPTGTVKSHLSRAKEKMATYLKQNGYDGKQ